MLVLNAAGSSLIPAISSGPLILAPSPTLLGEIPELISWSALELCWMCLEALLKLKLDKAKMPGAVDHGQRQPRLSLFPSVGFRFLLCGWRAQLAGRPPLHTPP